jgi:glycosyltransferase involved in cell wall biosynthesis
VIKVLYIVSDIDRALAFEWIANCFDANPAVEISFCFLAKEEPATAKYIAKLQRKVFFIYLGGKRSWPSAFLKLSRILWQVKPEIVHCHLLTASVLGLSAAYFTKIKFRIFTRHHGSMHHDSHRKGIVWDIICNTLATTIVSISPATTTILSAWERVPKTKIAFIPHGFLLSVYGTVDGSRRESFMAYHGLPAGRKIVGVVSRFEEWKGIQYTIEAFKGVLRTHSDIHLLLMNAVGSYASVIHECLQGIPSTNFTLIPFDSDIAAAYAVMDAFVHVPIDPYVEAFGQVYVEALASGVPMICTLSGIAPAIIMDSKNALVVPFRDSKAIEASLLRLFNDDCLAESLSTQGKQILEHGFALEAMCQKLEELYVTGSLK